MERVDGMRKRDKACCAGNNPLIGILMLNTAFKRIPGDIGNPRTFKFPVLYETIQAANPDKVVVDADHSLVSEFVEGAQKLERKGVKAITTSCGFMAIFQDELREEINTPIFTSSLLQVPMISKMLRKGEKVGVITADSRYLTKKHLESVGITDDMKVVISGMEPQEYFKQVYADKPIKSIDAVKDEIEQELVVVANGLLKGNPDVRAVVLECTNLPPFAGALRKSLNVPIFDVVSLTNLVHEALCRP
jgi:Asp/Glu/hydantoin racemase